MSGNRPVVIAPSILAADFARLGEEVARVTEGGAALLHLDVMDGRFVPNITFGMPVVAALRRSSKLPLDVHLMIVEPERYVLGFREAGADMVSVHVEAAAHLHATLQSIRRSGAQAGVAINPGTPVTFLPEVLDVLDYVLVMSVNPGFGGQKLIPRALQKIAAVRALLASAKAEHVRIEVDGGIDTSNAAAVAAEGARILVCGSSVFHAPDPAEAVRAILAAARGGA